MITNHNSQQDLSQHNPQINNEQENEINLGDLLMILRDNWYWFALSVALCAICAIFYIKATPKTYQRTASVLIRDDKKGGANLGESAMFADLGLLGGGRNVDNELLVFQSRTLVEKVVRRLSLHNSSNIK